MNKVSTFTAKKRYHLLSKGLIKHLGLEDGGFVDIQVFPESNEIEIIKNIESGEFLVKKSYKNSYVINSGPLKILLMGLFSKEQDKLRVVLKFELNKTDNKMKLTKDYLLKYKQENKIIKPENLFVSLGPNGMRFSVPFGNFYIKPPMKVGFEVEGKVFYVVIGPEEEFEIKKIGEERNTLSIGGIALFEFVCDFFDIKPEKKKNYRLNMIKISENKWRLQKAK